jgi:hypothetical protein
MRGSFSVACLSLSRRVAEEFKSPQSLVGHNSTLWITTPGRNGLISG